MAKYSYEFKKKVVQAYLIGEGGYIYLTNKNADIFAGLIAQGSLKDDVTILIMGSSEAEAVKLFANTYLALRVSFFNELDTYSEIKGHDTAPIINGICSDPPGFQTGIPPALAENKTKSYCTNRT